MEDKNNALDDFLGNSEEEKFQEKVRADKKKFIKSDRTIVERFDKIILVDENNKQLLREQY